jgi:uncharacterized protein (TIGR02246 family)
MGQATSSEVRAKIEGRNKAFMEAVGRGDLAAVTALYTSDGQVLPPNAEAAKGHEAIHAFWQAIGGMGVKRAQLDTREVEGHGDTAIEVGAYTLFGEGDQALDNGKYIVIWKKEDGQWKLHRDIFNSNLPPRAS